MSVLTNPRHERFAQELAKGKTGDEAYILAGYQENRHNASRLKTKETITARVAELQDRASQKVAVTLESIAIQFDEDRDLAHRVKQAGAAVSASTAKAKLYGWMSEKHEHTGKDGGPIEVSARSVIAERLAGLASRSEEEKPAVETRH